jgi:hypothetical protein
MRSPLNRYELRYRYVTLAWAALSGLRRLKALLSSKMSSARIITAVQRQQNTILLVGRKDLTLIKGN